MITAIIIDDERLARLRVKELLVIHHQKIEIIGEADTGNQAISIIEKTKPDLLFLDIHLPDMTGFQILEQLSYQPRIIFTTAYDKYAIEAFENLTIDYLVKPLTEIRFNKSIDKLMKLDLDIINDNITDLLNYIENQEKRKPTFSLAIKKGHKIILIDFIDIAYFKSEDKYVSVILQNGTAHLTDKTLTELENIIPESFSRVHRSFIVNRSSIKEVQKYFKGTLILKLDDLNKSTIKVSETYVKKVKKELGI